jgi:hypothetical protein
MEMLDKLLAFAQSHNDHRLGLYRLDLAVLSLLLETGLVSPEKAIERFELFLNQWSEEEREGPKGSALRGAIHFVKTHTIDSTPTPPPKFGIIPGGRRD